MTIYKLAGVATVLGLGASAFAQGGFTAPPKQGGGVTVQTRKPDLKTAAKLKANREKLLKELKLTASQKTAWDALEAKAKADRMAIIKLLQSGGGGDAMAQVAKLQALSQTEVKGKRAILTDAQRKIFDKSPAAKGATVQTRQTGV